MTSALIQPSFAAGELSPSLLSRVDLAKYHIGAALLRNFYVDYRGGASNRAGTLFVGRCRYGNRATRNIPFQFSILQTYMLEFGDLYMRVIKAGAYVLEPSVAITGATIANPAVITAVAHGFANGDWVYISGILGPTRLNGQTFQVAGVTANTFSLQNLDGAAYSSVGMPAYVSGGTVARVFTLTTPYAAADLALLKFTQSDDTMTLTHPSYAARDLTRTAHYIWTLTVITFGSTIAAPTGLVVVASDANTPATGYSYITTAIDTISQDESLASSSVSTTNADSFYTKTMSVNVSWAAVTGAQEYRVYRAPYADKQPTVPALAVYGYIGRTNGLSMKDVNITADYSRTPPTHKDPFAGTNYPGCVCYFQQRKTFASSSSLPETIWMSQVGSFKNMDVSNPVKASDAITATLASYQVNAIKALVPMPSGLVVLTAGGAWLINGGSTGAPVTPSTFTANPQAYNGCSDVPPIVTNYDILYVQAKGSTVRDLAYNFYANVYTGNDMSVLSSHLFTGYQILEWAFAEEPHKLIWAVRDDGQLLSFTFLKEQDVYAWTHHDTFGQFKSVATIPESSKDAIYFIVKRYINGRWVQYQERLAERDVLGDVENSWFLDCALALPQPTPAANVQPSALSGAAITLTADAAIFTSADIGKVFRGGGGIGVVTARPTASTLTVKITRPITFVLPNDPSSTPVQIPQGKWTLTTPVTTLSGLDHLEGMTLNVLGDGNVFSNKVVVNGSITLEHSASAIVAGLPYTAQLKSLYVDVGDPTIQGKLKKLSTLTVRVDQSRGLKAGSSFSTLVEIKERTNEPMGQPIGLQSRDERVVIDPSWNPYGQICLQQDYPLPATILGIIPELTVFMERSGGR